MDAFEALQELQKETSTVDKIRRPLVPSERNNGITTSTRRSKTREVSSRYKSPTPPPTVVSNSRRCPSPNLTRNVHTSSMASKRALSVERKRPSTPLSPTQPSTPGTPVSETSVAESKKMTGSRLPEVLWPSTMRSFSVSFQSDSISVPASKKEKPALSERTLKPSSNVRQRQSETASAGTRKPTPERKRSPLKGKNLIHQLENSRPVEGAHARLIDQHRWPSRAGGKLLTKSMDLSVNAGRIPSSPNRSSGIPSLRRLSAEGIPRPLYKTSSDASQLSEFEDIIGSLGLRMKSVDDSLIRMSALHKASSPCLPEKAAAAGVAPSVRSRSVPGSRLPSPSRTCISKATPSPTKTRPSTPIQSRGANPSRIRASSPIRQSSSTSSVLSFVADIKKGKKSNQLEDAHQLRLLYNRHLEWRFANARTDAALYFQKFLAEETLYNVWKTNLELWDSVIRKRIELQWLSLELKLNSVLTELMPYLEDWAIIERDHSASLDRAIKDLEASTLRIPVTGGAKADIDSLNAAMRSAADVMQMMGSSIYSLLSKVEGMNGLVSELSELEGQQRAMLNECDALLSSTADMQVKEYSLSTQLIQSQQDLEKTKHRSLWPT